MNKIYKILFITAVLVFGQGCLRDSIPDPVSEENWVTLSFQLPGTSSSPIKGISTTDENSVRDIQVMAFGQSGNYLYTAGTTVIEGTGAVKTCRIRMKAGNYDLLILANSAGRIDDCFPWGINEGTTREAIEEGLEFSVDGIWDLDQFGGFPMWGEKTGVTVTTGTTIDNIKLIRAVAKVNVKIDGTATSDFTMECAYLYRTLDKGRIVPVKDIDHWDGTGYKAIKPSVPDDASPTGIGMTTGVTDNGKIIEKELYVAESPAGTRQQGTTNSNTSLVIGGKYKGTESYYRIDFVTGTGSQQEYLPILRNHSYTITITDIERPGAMTPDQAAAGNPANVKYEIIPNNDGNIIGWNDQHQLVLNTDSLLFYAGGNARNLRVYTDHPSGWKITGTPPSWITFSATEGVNSTATMQSVIVTAQPLDDPDQERDGKFTVTAGDISIDVFVTQVTDIELFIEADPDYIIFYANPVEQLVTLMTSPADAVRYFSYSGNIEWETGGFPADGTDETIRLLPKPNTTNTILSGVITVMVKDDQGNTESTEILVRQFAQDNPFTVVPDAPYLCQYQENAFFTMSATQNWTIKGSVPEGAVTLKEPGIKTANSPLAEEYGIIITKNNSFESREIVVTFVTEDGSVESDVVFLQAGAVPTLLFYNPDPIEYDIHFTGPGPHTADVGLELNFPWRLAFGSGYEQVVASNNYQEDTRYDVPDYTVGNAHNIRLTSFPYTNGVGMPLAGTEYTTQLFIWNTEPSPSPQVMGTINVKRTIEARWDMHSIAPAEDEIIPRKGGEITVTAGANTDWNLIASSGLAIPCPANPLVGYDEQTLTITIPVWTGLQPREVDLYHEMGGVMSKFAVYTQQGYVFQVINKTREDRTVRYWLGTGEDVEIRVTGDYPDLLVRAVTDNQTLDQKQVAASEEEYIVTLALPFNTTGARRPVDFEYSPDNGNTWVRIGDTLNQLMGNYLISHRSYVRHVASVDISPLTWAEAMGVGLIFNTGTYYNSYLNQDRENPEYPPSEQSGCILYSEGEYGAGNWRMPTSTELQMMVMLQRSGEYDFGLQVGEFYQSSYDNGLNKTRRVRLNSDGTVTIDEEGVKSQPALTRCVVSHRN